LWFCFQYVKDRKNQPPCPLKGGDGFSVATTGVEPMSCQCSKYSLFVIPYYLFLVKSGINNNK
jgi:hypothetical protein